MYLVGQIEALRSGDTGFLRSFLSDPAAVPFKPGIYYTIWKVSGDVVFRTRLLNEFPRSPEALALKDGTAISAAGTALWLFGDLSGVQITTESRPDRSADASQTVTVEPSGTQEVPSMLQTGLFGKEENAQALADRLRKAGFIPAVTIKTVNGTQSWAVGVQPGSDYNRTILLLKDAGFEAFPVY
jgi:hypothetical protein